MEDHIKELEEQLDFMRDRLEETRNDLDGASLVIEYDNGGGQKGTRKNPAFDAYNQLMRTYTHTLAELRELVGKQNKTPQIVKFEQFAKTMRKVATDA